MKKFIILGVIILSSYYVMAMTPKSTTNQKTGTGNTVTFEAVAVSTLTAAGMYPIRFLLDGDPTSTPSAIGILMIDTANDCELYISTGTGAGEWEKVGSQ